MGVVVLQDEEKEERDRELALEEEQAKQDDFLLPSRHDDNDRVILHASSVDKFLPKVVPEALQLFISSEQDWLGFKAKHDPLLPIYRTHQIYLVALGFSILQPYYCLV